MISVSGKEWEQKKINQNLIDKLKQDFNFSDILSRLIISRKFDDNEIATIDTNSDLNNVFKNNEDFNQSIKLVVSCIYNNFVVIKYKSSLKIAVKSIKSRCCQYSFWTTSNS